MRSLITAQLLVGSCELKFWFWRISRDFSENFGRGYPQILEVDVLKKYITQAEIILVDLEGNYKSYKYYC